MNSLIFVLLFIFTASFWLLLGAFCIAGLRALLTPKWAEVVRPSVASLTNFVYPLLVLFGCVVLARDRIFPWVREAQGPTTFHSVYLSLPLFMIRAGVYFGLAFWFRKLIRHEQKIYGALSLIIVLVFGSLAGYDWIMSVYPKFHSTIFGLLTLINGALVAYAYSLTRIPKSVPPDLRIDVYNVFLAMIAIWSYFVVVQYLTVWSGNLPDEAAYFKVRFHGLSGTLAAFVMVGQTLICIPLLLFRKLKTDVKLSGRIAYLTLTMQSLHLFWMLKVGS